MLTPEKIERISTVWGEPGWPEDGQTAYARSMHRRPFSYYLARVRHLGISGGTLVDVGCGTGTWAFAFASKFEHVLGFDYNPARVAMAQWLRDRFELPQVDLTPGNALAMPVEDGVADAVFCYSVAISAVPLDALFAESFRVLRPGGILYVELNGIGYWYEMAASNDEHLRMHGRRAVYNSYAKSRLAPLIEEIGPGGRLNAVARDHLNLALPPSALLAAIGAGEDQIAAAATIEADLGPEYGEILSRDLAALTEGRLRAFSHARGGGRGYKPEELLAVAGEIGFGRYEWALEGCLSLGPDGAATKGPAPDARPNRGEYQGRLRRFESLIWKPGPP
jgi:SAM-dependent methyltransferase